jgi:hypothetical protein
MIQVAGFLFCIFLTSCQYAGSKKIVWVGCEMQIDSVYVSKEATRGSFIINDTLGLSGAFPSYQFCYYDEIVLSFMRLDSTENEGEWCRVWQVKVPFWLHKRAGSDTLFVVQNNKTFLFKVPEQFCGDPEDYWKGP